MNGDALVPRPPAAASRGARSPDGGASASPWPAPVRTPLPFVPPSFGLDALLEPVTREAFLRDHWPGRFFVVHGALARVSALVQLPALSSVESVLSACRERPDLLQTWFRPPDVRFSQRGRVDEALAHYRQGARLQFNQVEASIPELAGFIACLERDLGLPMDSISATIVASTRPAVAEPHFDSYPAFTLQLKGHKRWQVGPELCRNALDSFVLDGDPVGIEAFHDGALPLQLPPDARVVDVAPGTVLYMPSGVAHAVESGDDALSLAFDLVVPRWTELVVRRLTRRLNQSPAWRGFALGLGETGSDADRAGARAVLERLLAELPSAVAEVASAPDAILDVALPTWMPCPRGRYRRREGATIGLETAQGPDAHSAQLRAGHANSVTEITLSAELVPFCRWLIATQTPFSMSDALYAARALGALAMNVREVLLALVDAGALELEAGR